MKKTILIFLTCIFTTLYAAVPTGKILIGYWQAWQQEPNIPSITSIPTDYSVINVSFGTFKADGSIDFSLDDYLVGDYKAQAIKDIATVKAQGRHVVLSVGGANSPFSINSEAKEKTFLKSFDNAVKEYGFDGIDFDIEHGIEAKGSVDKPEGNVIFLIDIIHKIRAEHPDFIISLAPETANIAYQDRFGDSWNNYIPVINQAGSDISWVQLQEYNSGGMFGIDGNIHDYKDKSVPHPHQDFIENITPVLIEKWTQGSVNYAGLKPSQVVVGLPATEQAAGSGFAPFSEVKSAMTELRQKYPDLLGIMTWSINWDSGSHYQFDNSLYACAIGTECT